MNERLFFLAVRYRMICERTDDGFVKGHGIILLILIVLVISATVHNSTMSSTLHNDVFQICLTVAGEPHRRIVVEISEDCSMDGLQQLAEDAFGQDCIDLKSGFPPKSLLVMHSQTKSESSAVTATSLVRNMLNRNDRVTVMLADDKSRNVSAVIVKKKKGEKNAQGETESTSTIGRRSQRAASKAATESFSEVIKAQNRLLKEQKQQSTATKRKRTTDTIGTNATRSSPKKATSAASKEASRRLAKLPGRRLGDGEEVGPKPVSSSSRRRLASSRPKLHNAEDVSFALLNALEGGGAGGKVGQVLRGAMRNAVTRQYDTSRAVTRVSAVQAGKYEIMEMPSSSSLVISFDKGLEGRGNFVETVDAIPREALELVLKGIHASDPESLRANMLAQLSPRVFWSLLKETSSSPTQEGGAGNGRSTDVALQELLPTLDWSFLRRRKQTLSEKAQENLRQASISRGTNSSEHDEEEDRNLKAAAEAVQAVEDAMEQLHHYDQTQRRNRAAEAALARLEQRQEGQQEAWHLVTPTELDEDELTECIGGDTDLASKLVDMMGIHNWRQLANANLAEIAKQLCLEEGIVEVWIDRAQEESVEEIIVEICDGRVDAVEVLRSEANTGTPKDLANWRSMPDMLFKSASSSLERLGVTVEDVTTWCHRAYSVMQDYEWMTWYATPVE